MDAIEQAEQYLDELWERDRMHNQVIYDLFERVFYMMLRTWHLTGDTLILAYIEMIQEDIPNLHNPYDDDDALDAA